MKSQRVTFMGSSGTGSAGLEAMLDLPDGPIAAYALLVHCFAFSKDFIAARRISAGLAARGFAVLRFDFTGLGAPDGELANPGFSANVEDLMAAAAFLRANYRAPAVLVGHSLGGAAVLEVAPDIPEVRAVATIAAPAMAEHVAKSFLPAAETTGTEGELAGRTFAICSAFVEDIRTGRVLDHVERLRRPLLLLHSPLDQVVGIDNASAIFTAARHPKSFVSLEQADHLLTSRADAAYVADVIAAWAARYVEADLEVLEEVAGDFVTVTETLQGRFQARAFRGAHRLIADEPTSVGGLGSGPSPYDFLAIALGACTTMTLRMYADHKGMDLGRLTVEVKHGKVDVDHCEDCAAVVADGIRYIDRFECRISVEGGVPEGMEAKLLEIAGKCPVHRTLHRDVAIVTKLVEAPQPPAVAPETGVAAEAAVGDH